MTEQEEEEGEMPYDDHVPLNEGAVGKTKILNKFRMKNFWGEGSAQPP